MKICFIDWFAYGLFNSRSKIVFGGAQIQLYLLANELSKNKKYDVCFLTDNQKHNQQDKFGQLKVFQFVRSPENIGIKGRLLVGNWHFLIRLLIQLRKIDADVYFQRAASTETGIIALICKLLSRRFIFMVAHEQDVNGDFIRENWWPGKLFSLGLKLADKIVCQTREQQSHLAKRLRDKSAVIAPGYPIKVPKKMAKRIVLWVARAEKWKNPELFLDLARKFPREKFTMICPPAENNPRYFQLIKAKAEAVSNIKFIKQVPFSKIDSYFVKAKVFVSTSVAEGFPNTFIQAGMNLVPLVSFKVNPDMIIEKHRLGFCANGSQKQMIKLLKKVLENNHLRQQLSVNAYNYVRQHHDLKETVTNIIENILRHFVPRNIFHQL